MARVYTGRSANTKEGYGYPLLYEDDSAQKKILFYLDHKEPSGLIGTPHYTVRFGNGLRLNQMDGLRALFDNYIILHRRYLPPNDPYSYFERNFTGKDALDPIVFTFSYKDKQEGKLTSRSLGFLPENDTTDEDHKQELLNYSELPVPFQSVECLTPYGIYFMRGLSLKPPSVTFTSPYRLTEEIVDLYEKVASPVLPDEQRPQLVEALDRGLSRYPLLDLDL